LARQILIEGVALGGLFEALLELIRRLVDLLADVLLPRQRATHLLAALERIRRRLVRTGLLPRHLLERALQVARLVGGLLERLLGAGLRLVDLVVHLGQRGEAQLEALALGAIAAVIQQHEAKRSALARQQPQRRGIPARADPRLARLAIEAG